MELYAIHEDFIVYQYITAVKKGRDVNLRFIVIRLHTNKQHGDFIIKRYVLQKSIFENDT